MPVFINEVVFRGEIQRDTEAPSAAPVAGAAMDGNARAALIAEVAQAVIDRLERELDRVGER